MEEPCSGFEDRKVVVRTLACVLQRLIDVNCKLDMAGTNVITKFHASRPPSISVSDYLERIHKYASCSSECFVLALVYIDRLIQQSNFSLNNLNIHRVLITSIMLAAKFFDDKYFNNLYYAKVGGVPCREINTLEVEFLFLINFSLHVTEEVYYRYYKELANHARGSGCQCCSASVPRSLFDPLTERAGASPDGNTADAYSHAPMDSGSSSSIAMNVTTYAVPASSGRQQLSRCDTAAAQHMIYSTSPRLCRSSELTKALPLYGPPGNEGGGRWDQAYGYRRGGEGRMDYYPNSSYSRTHPPPFRQSDFTASSHRRGSRSDTVFVTTSSGGGGGHFSAWCPA